MFCITLALIYIIFKYQLSPFKTVEDALSIIKLLSEPKASHNCWAFRTSSVPSYERCSDDGEPGGSAGRPILNALQSEGSLGGGGGGRILKQTFFYVF